MEINLMTWNTELYVYGTKGKAGKIIKPFDDAPVKEVMTEVQKFMDSF